MFNKIRHIIALCMAGFCCFGSDESIQYALKAKWLSFAGGSIDPDAVYALSMDARTNVYFGGVLGVAFLENHDGVDTLDQLLLSGGGSGFVSKVDKDGVLQWASTLDYGFGGASYGLVSTNNVVYSAGLVNNQADVYVNEEVGYVTYTWTDAILSCLSDVDGGWTWSQDLSSVSGSNHYNTTNAYKAVATDAYGYIYAVGYTTITNLSSFSSNAYAGGKDAVVVKYTPDGDLVWIRYLGGANADEANAVSVGQGGLYVSGTTHSPGNWITLGNKNLPSAGNACGFLSKLDFSGNVNYTTVLGGTAHDEILSMQATSNMIFLAGITESTNFCNLHKLNQPGGSRDGFVLKLTDYGSTYQTNWFRYVGTNTLDAVRALALMESDRVVVCGSTEKGGWMPEQNEFSKPYTGGTDGFILQLDRQTGVPFWSTYVGAESNDVACALATHGTSVFLGGTTGSMGWEMFSGFQDTWSEFRVDFLYSETGFLGRWSQEPGVPPVITNDISDVTVHEGGQASFHIEAQGKPAPKYLWLTNGVPVGGVPTNYYVVASALPSDNATTYQCIASNVFGCSTSRVAHLTVIPNGVLNVSLLPAPAVAEGATWQLTGGVWRTSEAIALYPGTYTVTFTNLLDWTTPATRQVVIESSKTTTVVAVYGAPVASAVRTVSNWTNVSLTVTCLSGMKMWTLVEQIPTNATPAYYGYGIWNQASRTLTYTGTVSSTVSYKVLLGSAGNYEVSGCITSMPINLTMPVTGDYLFARGDCLRKIVGTNVWIYMFAPTNNRPWTVEEDLSGTNLEAFNWSAGGDSMDGYVYWSGTTKAAGLVHSYSLRGPEGSTNIIRGDVSVQRPNTNYTIYGDSMIIIPKTSKATILYFTWNEHPAFSNLASVVSQYSVEVAPSESFGDEGVEELFTSARTRGDNDGRSPCHRPPAFLSREIGIKKYLSRM